MRRALAYVVPLALTAAGSLAAHGLAYRLVDPDEASRERLLASTGHGYLELVPLALGVGVALVVLGLAAELVGAFRGHRPARAPRATLAFLPLLAFVLQEHLERYLHTGEWPLALLVEPVFLAGLALQLPMAIAALAAARALLRAARDAGEALAATPRRPWALAVTPAVLFPLTLAPEPAHASRANHTRGPPASS